MNTAPPIVDFSPHQPEAAPKLDHASRVVLIDNYDSFTWNVYQYLVLEGATVTVYRNDEVTLDQLIAMNPTQLVISPGPGHPLTDSGISREAIEYYGGKVPVLGVCMGHQCMYSVYGGTVDITGEIFHGKASPLKHDEKGLFAGVRQDIPVTRYHSLAGTEETLPSCLEVTAWTFKAPNEERGEKGGDKIIMGVRHKEYTVEGVQFHPEGILTEQGRRMMRNFLMLQKGTWADDNQVSAGHRKTEANSPAAASQKSILQTIYDHRKESVEAQKMIPAHSPENLQRAYELGLAPPSISFLDRVRKSPFQLSLMAEIKRASPSKGVINIDACAPAQAREYALAGASVISVLTEPKWFKGSIDDLRQVRQTLEGMPDRPAILRKEFIFDEYQILEARLAGADTVLLIVKMLDVETLSRLYKYSVSLGMEPLVEVNTAEEMQVASSLGAKVIGVNNRNLVSFEVDLETASRLLDLAPEGSVVCALSGISWPSDVVEYQKKGIGAVLIGEALMRAADPGVFATLLLGGPPLAKKTDRQRRRDRIVKVCGTRTPEAAAAAIESGATMIGIIRVKGRRRYVTDDVAVGIAKVVQRTRPGADDGSLVFGPPRRHPSSFFHHSAAMLRNRVRALLVGVFQDQPLDYVLEQTELLQLDIVQLHGSEPVEWARQIPVPVIRAHRVEAGASPSAADVSVRAPGYHAAVLLDSGAGGSGESIDLDDAASWIRSTADAGAPVQILLAGGLEPDSVSAAIEAVERKLADINLDLLLGVDVSSGVEGPDGAQDLNKIRRFVAEALR